MDRTIAIAGMKAFLSIRGIPAREAMPLRFASVNSDYVVYQQRSATFTPGSGFAGFDALARDLRDAEDLVMATDLQAEEYRSDGEDFYSTVTLDKEDYLSLIHI